MTSAVRKRDMAVSIQLSRLRASLQLGAATQLGVGPMSRHCVDATIELANTARVPLMLIASRRQIECDVQGGGYVNRWNTRDFARYVRERDRGGYVVLCRDHGGPWQNYPEVSQRMSLAEAMASAKESFRQDIEAGFDIIHIDPSTDVHADRLPQATILDRVAELYEHCMEVAVREGNGIGIEVGSEEQSGVDQDLDVLANALQQVRHFCERRRFEAPMFVVAQTGTLVKETRNVGSFDDPFRKNGAVPAEILVPRLLGLCAAHGIALKEHNGDYLSNEALMWHPRLGIHATNVAPEFGVAETRHVFFLCREFGCTTLTDRFAELAYNSGKWRKWMLPDTTATDFDRATIAGHYVFGEPEYREVFETLRRECEARGLDLDASIRDAIKLAIMRIMACFNLCRR